MASSFHQNGEEGLRDRLQVLLDDGTLGQRILAQQMELEDRINQLPLSSSSLLDTEDVQVQDEIREKLKELEAILSSWEDENATVFLKLTAQPVCDSFYACQIEVLMMLRQSTKLDSTDSSIFQVPKLTSGRKSSENDQTSAMQSSRRAKNAAHRADDVGMS
jgi:hypothetical protein